MPITPDQYPVTPVYDLLNAAARGHVGIDHRFLHAVLDERERSIPDLVRFASEDRSQDRVNLEDDLALIAWYLRAVELVPFLVECIGRDANAVSPVVAMAVCAFRKDAVEPLLALYRATENPTETEIPFLLALLDVKDPRIEEILSELSRSDPPEGRFCTGIYEELTDETREDKPVDIWFYYPAVQSPPLHLLPVAERGEFLDSPAAEHRAAAADSLVHEIDRPGDVILKLVRMAKQDPEPSVRGAAWRALALEVDNQALRHQMRDRLCAPATPAVERAGLVVALASDARREEVREHILQLVEAPATRAAALQAMWRSGDKTFTPYVERYLDDADPQVREQAVLGVGSLQMTGELDRLRDLFGDPDIRPIALLSYTLAVPSEVSPARFQRLFAEIQQLAGGLDADDARIVRLALNKRLAAAGQQPLFHPDAG